MLIVATETVVKKRRTPHGGRKLSDDQVAIRRADVEEALATPGGFGQRVRAKLMAKWGIGAQTLWDDRTAVLESWDRMVNTEPRAKHRAALVMRAQFAAGLAANRAGFDPDGTVYTSPDVGNILKGIAIEAKLLGANAPERLEVEHSGSVDLIVRTPEEKAMSVLRALPLACKVLGIDAPVIDIPVIETTKEV